MKLPISYTVLGSKIESALIRGKGLKLSDLFLLIGSNEEGSYEEELPDQFIQDLCNSLIDFAMLNPIYRISPSDLMKLVDTNKIRVFFSKKAFSDKGLPLAALLDHRKFEYPVVSVPKLMIH